MSVDYENSEYRSRLLRLRERLDEREPDWQLAVVTQKVSLYYLTGSMPEGVLLIERDGDATLWVRLGFERAVDESPFDDIRQMGSFRDIAQSRGAWPGSVLVEREKMSLGYFERFNRHFDFKKVGSIDQHLLAVRAVKSDSELEIIRRSGAIHAEVLETIVPSILCEGMSEYELARAVFDALLDRGAQGIFRVNMADVDMLLGYISFGENGQVQTNFNGPDGSLGFHPSMPYMGNRDRQLSTGDLVFVDVGCAVDGYHTDKTCVYSFGGEPVEEASLAHRRCEEIQRTAAELLRPGNIPSEIYGRGIKQAAEIGLEPFMSVATQSVRFLGHGVGLHIDELPVIANGFNEPLVENMVVALEPKKSLPGVGMVGSENTYLVTEDGGQSLTGSRLEIIVC
jgi:Xaa-Pro aminopeptidase